MRSSGWGPGSLNSSSKAFFPSGVRTGIPESISLSKYWGINLYDIMSVPNARKRITTHCTPLRFLSAASSLCFCSMACLCLVASEYSLDNNLLVTFSQSFLLSL